MVADPREAAPVQPSHVEGRQLAWWQVPLLSLIAWVALYKSLRPVSRWLAERVLGLDMTSHLGASVEFFIFEVPKVLLLLGLVVFGVGLLRSFVSPERTRAALTRGSELTNGILAALLGVVTPFCSCSAVPLFLGFVSAGVPLGVTFTFLIAAPLIDVVALSLLIGIVGLRLALIYLLSGLTVAVVAGWLIGRLQLEEHLEDWVKELRVDPAAGAGAELPSTWSARVDYAWDQVRDIMGRVWPFVVLGILVGAGLHGYVPEGFMARLMGADRWWSVPAAVALGVPMYSNVAGLVPVLGVLLAKGAALGTSLAFMMAVIALSLPEAIILRRVLKPKLLATFFAITSGGILLVGYLFNTLLR